MAPQLAIPMPSSLRKMVGPAVALLLLAFAAWWLFGIDRVEERVRDEEVEMFDLAVPPPPPPPEPVEQPEVTPEKIAETADTVQPDPLSPPQPTSTNPPAGDLSSLLQDPTSDSGAFTGGPRGQGGTGKGALIGGTGRGGNGASRAYAELVQRALMRQLRKRSDLAQASFDFRVSVRVSGTGQLDILGLSNVRPPNLEGDLLQTLRGLSRIDTPPPAGVPNQITLQLNQA